MSLQSSDGSYIAIQEQFLKGSIVRAVSQARTKLDELRPAMENTYNLKPMVEKLNDLSNLFAKIDLTLMEIGKYVELVKQDESQQGN